MNDFMPKHTNMRSLKGLQSQLDMLGFARYEWFRKWCGGHWEKWYIDVVHSQLWIPVNACIHSGDDTFERRPPLGRGTPICESH